jgi:hypothetical protein
MHVEANRFGSKAWLKSFFTGSFPRGFFLNRLVPLMYCFLFGCLLVADLLFPPTALGEPGYIPFTRTISGQGNHGDNPFGAWFFTIGLVGTAIILVPFNIFTWRRLSAVCKHTAGLALFFAIIGAAGFAMVGIWDERSTCLLLDGAGTCILRSNDIHDVGSAVAFGGNLLAVLTNLFPMISRRRNTGKDEFGVWWQFAHVISFIAYFAISGVIVNANGVPAFFQRYAFWQWSLFTILAVYFLSFALRMPASIPS